MSLWEEQSAKPKEGGKYVFEVEKGDAYIHYNDQLKNESLNHSGFISKNTSEWLPKLDKAKNKKND